MKTLAICIAAGLSVLLSSALGAESSEMWATAVPMSMSLGTGMIAGGYLRELRARRMVEVTNRR